jgi:hypothetical protein
LSLKALFVAKVSPRFLQAGKSTLVDENFDCFALSFRSATLLGLSKGHMPHLFCTLYLIYYRCVNTRHKVTKTKKSTLTKIRLQLLDKV